MEPQTQKQKIVQKTQVQMIDSYIIIGVIGKHSYNGQGEIYQCKHQQTGEIVAIKMAKDNEQFNIRSLQRQGNILKILKQKSDENLANQNNCNIVRYIEKRQATISSKNNSQSKLFIALQFAQDGNILEKIIELKSKKELISELVVIQIALQLLNGLSHIHSNGYLHLDIKSANVLIFKNQKNCVFKICDFGHSMTQQQFSQLEKDFQFGTPAFWPPEIQDKNRDYKKIDGKKIDIFCVGVIILCLYGNVKYGKQFYQLNNFSKIESDLDLFWKPLLLKRKKSSKLLKQAISGMLHPNPQIRYQIKEVVQKLKRAEQKLEQDKLEWNQFLPKQNKTINQVQKPAQGKINQQNNSTRSVTDNFSKYFNKLRSDLQNMNIANSIPIYGVQYFTSTKQSQQASPNQKEQKSYGIQLVSQILAILKMGLLTIQTEEKGTTYSVVINNLKTGLFTIQCTLGEDEEGNQVTVNIQGQLVRNDDKYGIFWKYYEDEFDKLQLIQKFQTILESFKENQ